MNSVKRPDNTSNHCIYCGHELPVGASFCPYCEKEQVEAVSVQAPPRKNRTIAALILAAFTVAVIVCLLILNRMPKVYQGGSKIVYPIGDQTVDVIASYDISSGADGHVSPELSTKIESGNQGSVPLWLCVYSSEDESLVEEFAKQIASCKVEAIPVSSSQEAAASETDALSEDNSAAAPSTQAQHSGDQDSASDTESGNTAASSPMTIYGPEKVDDPSLPALWKTDLIYAPENGTNELRWTITMKNKDTIYLSQTMTCEALPVVDLYYQDVPLETVDDILNAMDSVSSDTILNLYLPPVTYDEPLNLTDRCVNLYGSTDGKQKTTFTKQITVPNRIPNLMTLSDLTFSGKGGTAILAKEGVIITNCAFDGWDVGIDAVEGSWPIIELCSFDDNKIGFRFNSESCTTSSDGCYATEFRNNDIGAYLIKVPGDMDFTFPECTFEGNGEDVKRE